MYSLFMPIIMILFLIICPFRLIFCQVIFVQQRTGKTLRFTIESRRCCRNGKSCKFKDYEEIKSSNTLATDS